MYDTGDMRLEFGFSIVGYEAEGILTADNKELPGTHSLRVMGNFPHTGTLRITKIQPIISMTNEPPRIYIIEKSGYLYLPPVSYMNSRRQAPVWQLSSEATIPLVPTHYRAHGTPLSWPDAVPAKVWLDTAGMLKYQIKQWRL